MKCIYFVDFFKGKRCGKKAFGLLGGNSYCKKHLDIKQSVSAPKEQPTPTYKKEYKSPIQEFHEMFGRAPNHYELIAMI